MSTYQYYTTKQRRLAIEEYRSGKSARQIEEEHGIERSTVWRWCREAGVSRTPLEARMIVIARRAAA